MKPEEFKALRQRLSLSQAETQRLLGQKSVSTVQAWEQGVRKEIPSWAIDKLKHLVPVLGSVPAGPLQEAIETDLVEWVEWRKANPGNVFALRVEGKSMTSRDIHDGDLIFVRAQQTAELREPVVARIGGEATLKRFGRQNDRPQLLGDDMRPIRPKKGEEVVIVGKVVDLWRGYE